MITITLKNIPDELYQAFKQIAERNRCSLNSEIIICLEQSMKNHLVNPVDFLADARFLRAQATMFIISDDGLIEAKNEGRI